MEQGLTISIESLEHRDGEVIVEMSGVKPQIMPHMVTKSRVRLKAIRAVGVEHIPRNVAESVVDGDFSRATELIDYEIRGGSGVGEPEEFNAAVAVARKQ